MKNVKAPNIVVIGILTVLTIIFWIVFEVIRGFVVVPPPQVPAEILAPLTPTLDATTLSALQQRLQLSDAEIGSTSIAPEATPTPAPTEAPVGGATESGQVVQEEATSGGEIVP